MDAQQVGLIEKRCIDNRIVCVHSQLFMRSYFEVWLSSSFRTLRRKAAAAAFASCATKTHLDLSSRPTKDSSLDFFSERVLLAGEQLKSKHLSIASDEADAAALSLFELES